MHVTPSRVLSATRTPGSVPRHDLRPRMPARGANGSGQLLLRPGAAPGDLLQRSVRRRHRRDLPERLRLISQHPEIADRAGAVRDRARDAGQHPARSCPSTRPLNSACDSPLVRPVLSDRRRSSPSPACDTIPVPSPVTSRPLAHAVTFTSRVLLELDPVET